MSAGGQENPDGQASAADSSSAAPVERFAKQVIVMRKDLNMRKAR